VTIANAYSFEAFQATEVKATMMRNTRVFVVFVLTACCGVTAAAESPANLLSVNSDYDSAAGPLEKARLLNGSVGGYEPMKNLNWLPETYDNLAAIGLKMIRLDHLVNDKFYRVYRFQLAELEVYGKNE
jgi:hypothetical protein